MRAGHLPRLPWGALSACVLAALGVACSNGGRDPGERVQEKVHPKIITSEPPPKVETPPPKPPPPEPHPRANLGDAPRAAEPKDKQFYDFPAGYDEVYDRDDAQRANAAFDSVMGPSLNPFGKFGNVDERDNPPNAPPERAQAAAEAGRASEKAKPMERIACRAKLELHKAAGENSPVVARLPLGTRMKIVARGQAGLAGNGDVSDWIQVDAEGRRGWLLDTTTHEVVPGEEVSSYLACCGVARDAEDEASQPRERFLERVDYVSCLSKAVETYGASRDAADLVLARAIALGRAAEMVERSDKLGEPYKGFMKRYGAQLDWDPEGYAVRATDMWAAEEKYRGEPAAEALAWTAAAYSAAPRTCGREVACSVARARAYWGEYLARYPNGVHAQEAMDAIAELRPRGEDDDRLQLDRNAERVEQCLKTIDSLGRIVSSSQSVGRVQALGALDGLRRFVLAKSGHVQTTR